MLYFIVQSIGSVQPEVVILETLHQVHAFLLLCLPEEMTLFEGDHGLGATITLLGASSVEK